MNETLVVLAIVTGAGMVNQDIRFGTMEECEKARQNIKHYESFCYVPPKVDHDAHVDQMTDIIKRMREALEDAKNNEETTPTL